MSIHLTLPMPPSVNKAYAGFPKRHKSNDYKKWEVEARKALKTQTKYSIEGDKWLNAMYVLHTDLYYKNGKKKVIDVANYEKLTSDFLSHEIPWFADHKIMSITLLKKQKKQEDFIEILVDELEIPE